MTESKTNVSTNSGMGLFGWLFIVFLILKLNPGGNFDTPIADWSWWWVTSPLWIPFLIFIVVLIPFCLAVVVLKSMDRYTARRRRKKAWKRISK